MKCTKINELLKLSSLSLHDINLSKTMKLITLAITALILSTSAFAQSPIGKGGKQINFGVGLYSSSVPVYFGMDFGVHEDITVGPQLGLDLGGDYFTASGRADYHFNTIMGIPRDWDFYAGLNLGFASDLGSGGFSGLDLGLQIGGRYYWNNSWGVNLEFGGGSNISGGRFGLSKRF